MTVHAVVGATGATGRVIVRELSARGIPVRAISRRGGASASPHVESIAADALDPQSLSDALRGAEVVYHCAMPALARWRSDFPRMTRAIAQAAGRTGARLVYADDTWMYGRLDGPISEQTPENPVSHKGVLRAWLAEMLLAAHARGDVEVTIGRASELFGPGVGSLLGDNLLGAIARGKSPLYIGNPDLPFTPTYIDDFARALIALGESPHGAGHAWIVPTPPPTTGRRLALMAGEHAGVDRGLRRIGSRTGRTLGLVWPLAREGAEMIYQFEQPFVVDGSSFTAAFGGRPTSYAAAVAATVDWYRTGVVAPVPVDDLPHPSTSGATLEP
jgi:nucleoside-diphosphate-sugar epimerase